MSVDTLAPEDMTADLAAAPPEEVDPEAPYGRNPKTGVPYKRSPEWRARTSANLKQLKSTAQLVTSASARARGESKPAKKSSSAPTDYTAGIAGLLQLPAFGLGMLATINPAFQLDAATIVIHTPVVSSALNAAAQDNEAFAALLDRILAVGPWGAVLGALLPLALQLAANHGLVPAGAQTGTLTAEQLAERIAAMAPAPGGV